VTCNFFILPVSARFVKPTFAAFSTRNAFNRVVAAQIVCTPQSFLSKAATTGGLQRQKQV
jgi:hypothetical protein